MLLISDHCDTPRKVVVYVRTRLIRRGIGLSRWCADRGFNWLWVVQEEGERVHEAWERSAEWGGRFPATEVIVIPLVRFRKVAASAVIGG